MGRQALLAVLCWLTFSETLGDANKAVNSAVLNDNVSEESAPRLYRNVPVGVYASAVPYASISYRLPAFLSGPVASASRVVPVKENLVFNNANGYLKDSYGNRFVGSPQSAAYKTTIPQQFVQLQALPAHLAQPLAVAAPSYQIKQTSPQIVFGSSFRIPSVQAAAPTPINDFSSASQPFTYAQSTRSFAPSAVHSHFQRLTAPQSTSNSAVYTQFADKYKNFYSEPKYQRLEEKPNPMRQVIIQNNISQFKEEPAQDEHANLKASPDTQTYTTIVNGKKTVIELDTKPPVPLLDLTLLEPLTFDNPVVPQVQHFLPKIHQATYQKLPEFTKQQKKNNSQAKKAKPKKKQKKPVQNDVVVHNRPIEPTVTFEGDPNVPEISYEINSPNYKETYKEQSLSYNSETTKKPVTFSYDHKVEDDPVSYSYGKIVQKEPVHYSYVHDSRQPGPSKEAYHSDKPKHLVYTFTPEEQQDEDSEGPIHAQGQSESGEAESAEVFDEKPHQPQLPQYHENLEDSPQHRAPQQHRVETLDHHQDAPSHKTHPPPQRVEYQEPKHEDVQRQKSHKPHHVENHQSLKHNTHHHVDYQPPFEPPRHNKNQPQRDGYQHHHGEPPRHITHAPQRNEHHQHHERHQHHDHPQHNVEKPRHSTHQPQRDHYHQHHEETPRHNTHTVQKEHYPQQQGERITHQPKKTEHHAHHEAPRQKSHQPQHAEFQEHRQYNEPAPRHKEHEPQRIEYQIRHENAPRHNDHPRPEHQKVQHIPHYDERHVENAPQRPPPHSQSLEVPHELEQLQPITQEYEEDIRLLPTHGPNAAIQVDPNQHVQLQQNSEPHPSPTPHSSHEEYAKQEEQPGNLELSGPQPQPLGAQPIVHEKSKHIIIQEEVPEEVHSHPEQLLAEMIEQEKTNEEDFEKAYKNAAFGFPGFERSQEDSERDIYNPSSYAPPKASGYNINNAAFQDYQAEGDLYPKTSRLIYKDASDGTKSDYYTDYLSHRPESFEDRSKKKQEYYKLYDSYRPEKYFAGEKQEKQKEKYTLAPTFSFGSVEPENEEKKKGYFGQYKAAPQKYEYSYTKPKPRDNSAFASRPYQRYASKTHFVEPQFQYGFEPIALPRLLDSELAAMASNNSPESEKPGMRKKIYKENWYIKKTSTAGGDAAR